jgi:hypothetical protein
MKLSKLTPAMAVFLALGLVGTSYAEAGAGRARARGDQGVVTATSGPNGGAATRSRGATQNADGSVTAGSAGAARTPQGGRAARGSTTTANPDGSATRTSRAAAEGANGGSASTQGATTRNADGTVTSSRETNGTNPQGGTYQGVTTYDPATGITRTTTCTNASGAQVACPR